MVTSQRPNFFWDYDLSDEEIRQIVRQGSPTEKAWVITRILEYAKWDDIWRYLSVDDIRQNFGQLRFRRPQDRELWAYALDRWANRELMEVVGPSRFVARLSCLSDVVQEKSDSNIS